jgi:hypothetical protein
MCVHSMSISEVFAPIWGQFGNRLVHKNGKIAPAWDQPDVIRDLMQKTWCKLFHRYLRHTYKDVASIHELSEHDCVVQVDKGSIIVSFAFNTDDEIETVLKKKGVIDEDTVEFHYTVMDALDYLTDLQTDEHDGKHGGDTTPTADTADSGARSRSTSPLNKDATVHPHMDTTATPWTYIRNC